MIGPKRTSVDAAPGAFPASRGSIDPARVFGGEAQALPTEAQAVAEALLAQGVPREEVASELQRVWGVGAAVAFRGGPEVQARAAEGAFTHRDLDLPVRARNVMARCAELVGHPLGTVDLASLKPSDLLALRGCGKDTLKAIEGALAQRGLRLAPEVSVNLASVRMGGVAERLWREAGPDLIQTGSVRDIAAQAGLPYGMTREAILNNPVLVALRALGRDGRRDAHHREQADRFLAVVDPDTLQRGTLQAIADRVGVTRERVRQIFQVNPILAGVKAGGTAPAMAPAAFVPQAFPAGASLSDAAARLGIPWRRFPEIEPSPLSQGREGADLFDLWEAGSLAAKANLLLRRIGADDLHALGLVEIANRVNSNPSTIGAIIRSSPTLSALRAQEPQPSAVARVTKLWDARGAMILEQAGETLVRSGTIRAIADQVGLPARIVFQTFTKCRRLMDLRGPAKGVAALPRERSSKGFENLDPGPVQWTARGAMILAKAGEALVREGTLEAIALQVGLPIRAIAVAIRHCPNLRKLRNPSAAETAVDA
jgi:hypothetical protein